MVKLTKIRLKTFWIRNFPPSVEPIFVFTLQIVPKPWTQGNLDPPNFRASLNLFNSLGNISNPIFFSNKYLCEGSLHTSLSLSDHWMITEQNQMNTKIININGIWKQ